MKKIIAPVSILILLLAFVSHSIAQPPGKSHEEKWDKFRAEKIAFLTSKLELSPDEAQRFWPVYNQLEKERWEAQKFRRTMEEKVAEAEETMSAPKIEQLTREFAGSLRKEADLLVDYNEKFLEILPPEKVLKLYKTENEFRMYMIKKFRDKRKNGQ
ncbi:hypothetical protein SAMN05444274_10116 [Mariniphaga anaerophila]|uniref:Sensor of ECF-type sigma factor n=1 Tax=Mariniphaga anaerophila TaxID=1484053 RepID=A0A1M4SFU0_9BACT|nr:hypothetical protein [Mariniphaga anaerophila]SHE31134.1 hypothetical protein SAMN05444274_10116 [Mariniphaga anaerophila]